MKSVILFLALCLVALTSNADICEDGSVWKTLPGKKVYRNGELLHRQKGRDGLVDRNNIAYVFGGPVGQGFQFWIYDLNVSDTLLAGRVTCQRN